MSRSFAGALRRQILDEKRRRWTVAEFGGDFDRFDIECITPLRDFQRDSFIIIRDHLASLRGSRMVDRVDLVGEVDFRDA